jgi:hypothetical protein
MLVLEWRRESGCGSGLGDGVGKTKLGSLGIFAGGTVLTDAFLRMGTFCCGARLGVYDEALREWFEDLIPESEKALFSLSVVFSAAGVGLMVCWASNLGC